MAHGWNSKYGMDPGPPPPPWSQLGNGRAPAGTQQPVLSRTYVLYQGHPVVVLRRPPWYQPIITYLPPVQPIYVPVQAPPQPQLVPVSSGGGGGSKPKGVYDFSVETCKVRVSPHHPPSPCSLMFMWKCRRMNTANPRDRLSYPTPPLGSILGPLPLTSERMKSQCISRLRRWWKDSVWITRMRAKIESWSANLRMGNGLLGLSTWWVSVLSLRYWESLIDDQVGEWWGEDEKDCRGMGLEER